MKARAPPPPGKPATPTAHSGRRPHCDASPVPPQSLLAVKEALGGGVLAITVVLPSGLETEAGLLLPGSRLGRPAHRPRPTALPPQTQPPACVLPSPAALRRVRQDRLAQ